MLHTDSKQLSSMVSFTSTLAENVSSKVRQLDLAKVLNAFANEAILFHCDLFFQQMNQTYSTPLLPFYIINNLKNNCYQMLQIFIHLILTIAICHVSVTL